MDIETGKILPENDCNECNLERDSFASGCVDSEFHSSSDDDRSSECPSECADRTDEIPCPICFEPCSSTNPLIRSDTCGHAWCHDCLSEYLEFQVSQHRVPLPCPSSASYRACRFHLSQELVRKHLSHSPTIQKYDRLDRLVQDESLVECPRCNEIVEAPAPPNPLDPDARHCPKCEHTFCFLHADAHLGINCRDYRVTPLQFPNTKPCSHCGAALHKYAGCDHVVCPACHNDMCFHCGTHQHLTGKVTRQCSKCQQSYLDHRYMWHVRLYYCLTLPFALPFAVAYVIIMLGLVLVSLCCCGCFGCGSWLYEGRERQANFSRGCLYVAGIISLPLILMLYDVGYHFQGGDDFLEWCLMESPDREERVRTNRPDGSNVPSTPNTTTSEDE